MKRILSLSMVLVIIFMLAACNSNTLGDNESTVGVSTEQMTQDISKHENIIHCFESDFVKNNDYELADCEIVKRQTNIEDKQDIIHFRIISKTEYISVEIQAIANYEYYDVGGWVLEELEITEKEATPLSAPDFTIATQSVTCAMQNFAENSGYWGWCDTNWYSNLPIEGAEHSRGCLSRHVSNFNFTNIEFTEETQQATLNFECISCQTSMTGYIQFEFDKKIGWQWCRYDGTKKYDIPYAVISIRDADYSEAIGTFIGTPYGGYTTKIEIIDIDTEKGVIFIKVGDTAIEEHYFHVEDGSFALAHGTIGYYYFYYNPNTRNWEIINSSFDDISVFHRQK